MILLANMEWVAAAIGLLTGAALGVGLKWLWELATRRRAHEEASRLLEATRREADALRAEARKEAVEEAARLREETEKKLTRRSQELETV